MESRQVRHFIAAYEHGTFAAAAAQLRLTQQAVSKSIARLEASLGIRLFERDGRRLRPTAYAELFLPHARAIAAEAERFRTGLDDLVGGRGGTLRIGVGPSAAAGLVASAVERFARQQPQVRVQVSAGLFGSMVDDLVLGRLDLFVAVRQVERARSLVDEHVIASVPYHIFAGAGHPLAGASSAALADLAGAKWIGGTALGDIEQEVAECFRAHGMVLPLPAVETTSLLFALALLQRGRHLMILPETLAAAEVAAGRLAVVNVRDAPPWNRPLVVACRRSSAKSRVVEVMLEAISLGSPGAGIYVPPLRPGA